MGETTYGLSARAAEFYDSTFVPALFGPWAARLVEAAQLGPGQTVLDVGCGTGVVARAAARQTGPGGRVIGLDLNEAMLAVARRRCPELVWRVGDASALPFEDDSFDRVLCQAALMFFADPTVALREMGRVARPAGRVVVQVPGRLSHSPGYLPLADVVWRHAGPSARDLIAAYFAAGDPELLARWFAGAGLHVERFETWAGATHLDSLDTFVAVELLPIAETVDSVVREAMERDARTALESFVAPDGAIVAPLEVHLVTARPDVEK